MATVMKSIEIDVPISTAYNQYTQFETFPQFMEGVKEVRQLDDRRLHWKAEIGGRQQEWDAEITQQVPDQVIAWHSTTGKPNGGRVMFKPLDANRCEVVLELEYDPEGLIETVGDKLGFLDSQVEGDLERFKTFVTSRGVETGAYRGEIR